jgi:hypothetical protein
MIRHTLLTSFPMPEKERGTEIRERGGERKKGK